jgi:hypothetical protein
VNAGLREVIARQETVIAGQQARVANQDEQIATPGRLTVARGRTCRHHDVTGMGREGYRTPSTARRWAGSDASTRSSSHSASFVTNTYTTDLVLPVDGGLRLRG